jgi:hypothetical protein
MKENQLPISQGYPVTVDTRVCILLTKKKLVRYCLLLQVNFYTDLCFLSVFF